MQPVQALNLNQQLDELGIESVRPDLAKFC